MANCGGRPPGLGAGSGTARLDGAVLGGAASGATVVAAAAVDAGGLPAPAWTMGRSPTRTRPCWLVKVSEASPLCCCEKPEIWWSSVS